MLQCISKYVSEIINSINNIFFPYTIRRGNMDIQIEKLIDLLSDIKDIEKKYDVIRIVDPVNRRKLGIKKNKTVETDLVWHEFWNKSEGWENCISLRAFKEKDVFIKIEYSMVCI